MSAREDATQRYGDLLAGKLVACGVAASDISVRYEDVIRDYEILISSGQLSQEQIERIDGALYPEGYVQFTDSTNAAAYDQVQSRRYRKYLETQAEQMPGLPRFDPASMTIQELAFALEDWCGVERGAGYEVRGEQLSLRSAALPLAPGEIGIRARLLSAMSVALMDHPHIRGGVIGGT